MLAPIQSCAIAIGVAFGAWVVTTPLFRSELVQALKQSPADILARSGDHWEEEKVAFGHRWGLPKELIDRCSESELRVLGLREYLHHRRVRSHLLYPVLTATIVLTAAGFWGLVAYYFTDLGAVPSFFPSMMILWTLAFLHRRGPTRSSGVDLVALKHSRDFLALSGALARLTRAWDLGFDQGHPSLENRLKDLEAHARKLGLAIDWSAVEAISGEQLVRRLATDKKSAP